jgi:uncharacterized membrane protein YgdD (TMEM256/DUF423 family)
VRRLLAPLAAVHGALAVAFGAFAAHGAPTERALELLEIGARYQGLHALAAIAAVFAGSRRAEAAGWLFIGGAAIFAGSLYAMAFGAPTMLGAATPIGGAALILGWLVLAVALLRTNKEACERDASRVSD